MKEKYPDYYLWTNPIFQTIEYKNFEQQMLPAVSNEICKFPMSQPIQLLMPEVAAVMKAGFSCLNTSINAVQAQSENNYRRHEESDVSTRNLIVDRLLNMASDIAGTRQYSDQEPNNEVRATLIEATRANDINEEAGNISSPEPPLSYRMNRHLVKVTDVWREYNFGLSDCPSVKRLENDFGTKWRKNKTESKFFCTRSVLYKEIQRISKDRHISTEEAAEILERRRIEFKASLDKLIKLIKASNR